MREPDASRCKLEGSLRCRSSTLIDSPESFFALSLSRAAALYSPVAELKSPGELTV